MFYEEKIIGGRLMCRTSPTGDWHPSTKSYTTAVKVLLLLSEEDRVNAMSFFCHHCGTDDPSCQCWNDD